MHYQDAERDLLYSIVLYGFSDSKCTSQRFVFSVCGINTSKLFAAVPLSHHTDLTDSHLAADAFVLYVAVVR